MDSVAEAIIRHYANYDETKRLQSDIGPVEFTHTQQIVSRYLPSPPATVFDVGGAAGPYSYWLAGLGFHVHLIDIVPSHIEKALEIGMQKDKPQLKSATIGDARNLNVPSASADVVMLNGPLYHLCDAPDRTMALSEARRILRPNGLLFAFAITRYAGLIYGLTKGLVFDQDYLRMIIDEVQTGVRTNPPDWTKTLPRAYFHLPNELRNEVEKAGFRTETPIGIVGPSWLVPDLDDSWGTPEKRATILQIARLMEAEPCFSPQTLVVARKSESVDSD